jgi:hypothetical protein
LHETRKFSEKLVLISNYTPAQDPLGSHDGMNLSNPPSSIDAFLLTREKTGYLNAKMMECSGDQRSLFRLVSTLTGKPTMSPLPSHSSGLDLAMKFSDYFCQKIMKIRLGIDAAAALVDHLDHPFTQRCSVPFIQTRVRPPSRV